MKEEIEIMKKGQEEMRNTISNLKNTIEGIKNRLDEDRISELIELPYNHCFELSI